MSRILLTALLTVVMIGSTMGSDIPQMINVQGKLTDDAGDPLPNGPHDILFAIWDDPTAGDSCWSDLLVITTFEGFFSANLGQVIPIPNECFEDSERWLSINVDGGAEMQPRQRFVSLPYAYYAEYADTADYANLAETVADGSISTVKIVDNAVTTMKINGNAVTTEKINDNAVTSGKILDETILFGDIGPNGAVDGKVIRYNGTAWAPDDLFTGDYKSAWLSIGTGDVKSFNHGLGGDRVDYLVFVYGRDGTLVHQANYGTNSPNLGVAEKWLGLEWYNLTTTSIKVKRAPNDNEAPNGKRWLEVMVRIIRTR